MATKDRQGRIVETPTEARQAERGPSVLVLLMASIALAILILAIVWFVFFRTWQAGFPALVQGCLPSTCWSTTRRPAPPAVDRAEVAAVQTDRPVSANRITLPAGVRYFRPDDLPPASGEELRPLLRPRITVTGNVVRLAVTA
jgi:hypothetical protein